MPCDEMTFARMRPWRSTTAAQVSSQLVSMARIMGGSWASAELRRHRVGDVVQVAGERSRGAPHDDRVLAVVLVVPASQPRRAEGEALVERERAAIGRPDLQRHP